MGYWNTDLKMLNQLQLYLRVVYLLEICTASSMAAFGTIHVEPTNANRKLPPVASNTETNANRIETMAADCTTIDLPWQEPNNTSTTWPLAFYSRIKNRMVLPHSRKRLIPPDQ